MKKVTKKSKQKDEDQNRFRFKSFNERVSEINIGVARRVGAVEELDEGAETFFHQGLQKWRELNCTVHFSEACSQLPRAVSLPQVLHSQAAIADALQKHLLVPNSLALQPLLDLVLQLARDLQSDFYEYFEGFFKVFASLLNTNNPDTIEQVFTSLSYLVKFLWHSLLDHICAVFDVYKVLLSSCQKLYIVAFAAESFAFLVRKLVKRKKFVKHVALALEDDAYCEGVGLLLFESVKGVCMHFHSTTEPMLLAWLPRLGHPSHLHGNEDNVLEALLRCMQEMAEYTRQEHCLFIWPLLLNYVGKAFKEFSAVQPDDSQTEKTAILWAHVERALRLVQKWVNWRWGTRLSDPAPIYKCVSTIVNGAPAAASSEAVQDLLVELVRYGKPFTASHARPVVEKVVSSLTCRQALEFIHRLIELGADGMEVLASLPSVLEQYSAVDANHPDLLLFLASLSAKLSADMGSVDKSWMFNLKTMPSAAKMICSSCQAPNAAGGAESGSTGAGLHKAWCATTALRIVRNIPTDARIVEDLRAWGSFLVQRLQENASSHEQVRADVAVDNQMSRASFALLGLMEVLVSVQGAAAFVKAYSVDWVLQLLRVSSTDVHVLKAALVVLDATVAVSAKTDSASASLTLEHLSAAFELLKPNLSHPLQPVRLATLQILVRFPQPLMLSTGTHDSNGGEVCDVIQRCLDAQQLNVTLHNFREKIRLLDQLKYLPSCHQNVPEIYEEVALRYLIGCLYINFQPVWAPVAESITSFVTQTNRKLFWQVFSEHLESCTPLCRAAFLSLTAGPAPSSSSDSPDEPRLAPSVGAVFEEKLLQASPTGEECRVDHLNFRMLLWRAMAQFAASAEASTRHLVPIFLSFIREEYSFLDEAVLKQQDLRHPDLQCSANNSCPKAAGIEAHMADEDEDDVDETPAEDGLHSSNPNQAKKQNRKALFKTLSTMLALFSKFIDPRSAHREVDMKQLMLQLLCHREEDIQRLALQYLLAYKPAFLLPYKEKLFDLLKETGFREALTHFRVDEESENVKPEHRTDLIPYLIRVLYGRMLRSTGMSTTGKQGSVIRRGVVLRFLAGCPGEEVRVFVQLISAPFQAFESEGSELPALDLAAVVPLRKQQGFLMMLGQMLPNLRNVLPTFLPQLLRIVLCIASWVSRLLSMCRKQASSGAAGQEQVDTRVSPLLRTLRQLALARLTEFFDAFSNFNFQPYMKSVLEVAVWPQLNALPRECLDHPTPLMKLLLGWSYRQRFLQYFATPTPEGMDGPILHFVFSCLRSAAIRQPVISTIMQIVDNLLNNGDDRGPSDTEPSAKRRIMATSAEATPSQETEVSHERGNVAAAGVSASTLAKVHSEGEKLLLPHLHLVLEHLGSYVVDGSTVNLDPSISRHTVPSKRIAKVPLQYLATLSRMSEFVESPSLSEKLVKAFLPLASKSLVHGDALASMLLTTSHLLRRVSNPEQFTVSLSRLFGSVKARSARSHLVKAYQVIGETNTEYQQIALCIEELNSWDRKRLEEPDYERRLYAFKSAADLLSEATSPTLVLALVYNALHTVHQVDDISMRDSACHFLHGLIQKLATTLQGAVAERWDKEILNAVFLPALQQGVRSKSETVRHEFVSLLAEAVRSLSEFCPRLANLQSLRNASDPETDFFENIRHIQMHRRTNALRSLAARLDEGGLPAATVASFILPLASAYLMTSASDHNLVTQAVAVLAAVAKQSPWARYRSLLQRYLRQLVRGSDLRKTNIRVVVAILECFHFDVMSAATVDEKDTAPTSASIGLRKETAAVAPATSSTVSAESVSAGASASSSADNGEADGGDVDEDADKVVDDTVGDMEEEEEEGVEDENRMEDGIAEQERKVALARRIFVSLRREIIPELGSILSSKSSGGGSHHLSNKETDNAELIAGMPVALAIVKLFQKLPEEVMHVHLPNVLLKVCNVLKSRSKDVRDHARQSLVRISSSLGPRYMSWVVKELRSALSRGYQLHVLGHALHTIMDTLVQTASAGEIDDCVPSMMEVVKEDLFGSVAEERDVGKITDKIPEARSSRSRLTLQLLAQMVGGQELESVLAPLKEVLRTTQSLKVVRNVEECLRHISLGLMANPAFATCDLLVMVHRVCSTNNSGLGMIAGKNKLSASYMPEPEAEKKPVRPDLYASLLLAKAPVRGVKAPGASKVTNMHVMIEFSLQLLLSCFKRSSINTGDTTILQMLDPLCSLLASFLSSQHVKLLSISLRCLVSLLPLPLPAMARYLAPVIKHLFKVLKEYSVAGAALGNNHEMVIAAVKAMTIIVGNYQKHKITAHQIELLMTYVEEDIHDFSRKGTAFPLLKAVLSRKFEAPIIHDVMAKVLELLVTADVKSVQVNCRQAMMQYLLDYSLGKKVQKHVHFLLKHLEFELESGRESVLEMLHLIFIKFPSSIVSANAGLFFVTIAPRLANDDSKDCRKLAALVLESLLEKVDAKEKDTLFTIVALWLDDKTPALRRLGYQTAGRFISVEGSGFERRLAVFLPHLQQALITSPEDDEAILEDEEVCASDHVVFMALTCLVKLVSKSRLLASEKHTEAMNGVWNATQRLLVHPHVWVRLYSCRLFGSLFAHWPAEQLVSNAAAGKTPASGRKRRHASVEDVYLVSRPLVTVSQLARRFLTQLSGDNLTSDLSLQVIKNLVYVTQVLCQDSAAPSAGASSGCDKPGDEDDEAGDEEDEADDEDDKADDISGDCNGDASGGDGDDNDDAAAENAHDMDDDQGGLEDDGEGELSEKTVDLAWVIRKMVRIAKYEAGHNQRQSTKRICVLKWLAAVTQVLHQHGGLDVHLANMLAPVMSLVHDKTKLAGAELHELAEAVLEEMRSKAGREDFAMATSKAERAIREQRDKRRQQRLLQNVANPELAAQRKLKLNTAKKEAKKRKLHRQLLAAKAQKRHHFKRQASRNKK